MIYDSARAPKEILPLWNEWAKEDGFDGIVFVGTVPYDVDIQPYLAAGYNAMIKNRLLELSSERNTHFWKRQMFKLNKNYLNRPCEKFEYKEIQHLLFNPVEDALETMIPSLIPNYDHSPRSGRFGPIFHNATPELFEKQCRQVFEVVSKKENPFVMLRSWNEWGEGNYVEPDMKYGHGYLEALRRAIKET